MGTKIISFSKKLEAFIDAKVESGQYVNASEVVCDGLRLMMQEEARKLEWLRNAIAEAGSDIAAGKTFSSAQLKKELVRRRKARQAAAT